MCVAVFFRANDLVYLSVVYFVSHLGLYAVLAEEVAAAGHEEEFIPKQVPQADLAELLLVVKGPPLRLLGLVKHLLELGGRIKTDLDVPFIISLEIILSAALHVGIDEFLLQEADILEKHQHVL